MRKTFTYLTGVFLFTLTIHLSCQKNHPRLSPKNITQEEQEFSVEEAKYWYSGNRENLGSKSTSNNILKIKDFVPRWDRSIPGNDENWHVIEVPLTFKKAPGFHIGNQTENDQKNINGSTSLLMLKSKRNGEISSALMHIYSNKTLKDTGVTYFNRDDNFSGTIFFTDLEGRFINGWLYSNGKIVGKASNNERNREVSRAELPDGCESVETDWYERTCIYYDDQSVECSGWEYVGTTVQTYCPDGGGGGGGGVYETQDIINNVNNPCIRNSVNEAISLDCKNQITNFVNSVFANNDKFHLQFNDVTFTGTDASDEARTSTGPMTDLTQTMTTIRFNNGQLGNASKEYIAVTILHEVIHAWINYKFPNPIDNSHQHSLMAGTNRFNLMRSALLEMYPALNFQDATDLTWGGLYNTIEFSNLSVSEKTRIIQTNKDYKNHTKGTPC